MRAGEDMNDKSRVSRETGKVEKLLHLAAGFEPDEPMPPTISWRLVTGRVNGENRTPRWFAPAGVLAVSVCAASIMLLSLNGPRLPKAPVSVPAVRIAQNGSPAQTIVQPFNPNIAPGKKPIAGIQGAHIKAKSNPIQNGKPAIIHKPIKRHFAGESRRWKSPKVKWQVATVRRFQTGVVASGWVAQPDAEDGTIRVSPALVEIPIASGEEYAPASTGSKHQAKHSSYEEIH
jgi:hypothetical protein